MSILQPLVLNVDIEPMMGNFRDRTNFLNLLADIFQSGLEVCPIWYNSPQQEYAGYVLVFEEAHSIEGCIEIIEIFLKTRDCGFCLGDFGFRGLLSMAHESSSFGNK